MDIVFLAEVSIFGNVDKSYQKISVVGTKFFF